MARAYWIPEYIGSHFTKWEAHARNDGASGDRNIGINGLPTTEDSMAVDPVCKMDVDEKSAQWKSVYQGKEYFFCSPGCKKAFDKQPTKYV